MAILFGCELIIVLYGIHSIYMLLLGSMVNHCKNYYNNCNFITDPVKETTPTDEISIKFPNKSQNCRSQMAI